MKGSYGCFDCGHSGGVSECGQVYDEGELELTCSRCNSSSLLLYNFPPTKANRRVIETTLSDYEDYAWSDYPRTVEDIQAEISSLKFPERNLDDIPF